MAPVWTKEQSQVINLRNRNILVSAAAGSGKTAVLVERILRMISDEEHPVDIDRLVIVTFTNAAAYEMKQRILGAIEKKMAEQPLNLNLRRQQTLLNHAQITTIDSFCLNIIRSYFSEIDLDPGFKVADEGELKLLMSDVLDEVIEAYYQEGNPAFYEFVECYTPEKTDVRLSDYILNLYQAAQSNPWPKEWLLQCKTLYSCETLEGFMDTPFMQYMIKEVRRQLNAVKELYVDMKNIAESIDGPYMYLDALNDDIMFVESLILAENPFSDCGAKMREHTFARLSSKKDASVDEGKKNTVKTMRDTAKKTLVKIEREYLNHDLIELKELILQCFPAISIYVDMTLDFMEKLDEKKRKKNLIHFSDMEHLALKLLVKKEGDKLCYTDVADELAGKYEEILIDEYQDSNLVQEIILNSISKERFGKPNVFMVGDVKQSIYRFRLARPELFIEKYDRYTETDSLYQKIELHKNFRSRESVLTSVNEVFGKIMKKEFGRIAYDDNAKLYAGMEFLPVPEGKREFPGTEVLVLEHEDESGLTDLEAEAVLCADTVRRLINDGAVCLDKETGKYRSVTYGDIVVLMRSAKPSAGVFVNAFAAMGIPALAESDTGYFSAYEISVLLSLLNIIDNPRQDVHLTAVLKSYFGGLTGNDLAKIRALCPDTSFYDAFLQWEDEKKNRFQAFLDGQRKKAEYVSIYELIWGIVYDTGYYAYVGTMPLGTKRQANIDMLMERAKTYENTSYHGLFNFVRYIERLKSYDVDYGEASLSGEHDNVVRIMTIHKSKGLEFPVVFLSCASKGFNYMDANQKLVIDSDLGIGTDFLDAKQRLRKNTVAKKAVSLKLRLDNLSEEQRILYVAMTRAKEKLYITGCVKNAGKALEQWQVDADRRSLTYLDIMNRKCYLDMVMPAALSQGSSFLVHVVEKDAFSAMYRTMDEANVREMEAFTEASQEAHEEAVPYEYPYELVSMPVKMTVSELKHFGQHEDEERSKLLIEEEFVPTVPRFISGEEEVSGAVRGSAYHKVMELLDYNICTDRDSVAGFMEQCVSEGRLSKEWAKSVRADDIVKFLDSPLGQEMRQAFSENKLYRERQFVMGIPAVTVSPDFPKEREILVQGVVDAYFETEQGLVLCDYKTDYVPLGDTGRQELVEKYKAQLDYYEIALNRMTGQKVIKKSIYSFKLGEEIVI